MQSWYLNVAAFSWPAPFVTMGGSASTMPYIPGGADLEGGILAPLSYRMRCYVDRLV